MPIISVIKKLFINMIEEIRRIFLLFLSFQGTKLLNKLKELANL